MVPNRMQFQRRRSQSTTATSPPRRSIDDAYRVAAKRAYPHRSNSSSESSSESSSSSKWDLGVWRHGKRRRRDVSHPTGASDMDIDHLEHIAFTSNRAPGHTSALPSSPAAFQLFPMAGRRTTQTRRLTCHSDSSALAQEPDDDLNQLRSSAFWELHRSVAESGEGFVRRMRDYENSRKGKRRASVSSPPPPMRLDHMSDCSDDEDDVQILDGASSSDDHSRSRPSTSPSQHSDYPQSPFAFSTLFGNSQSYRCSDVQNHAQCFSSALPSPTHASSDASLTNTPALTHIQSDSARSSLVSLPLFTSETQVSPPPAEDHPSQATPAHSTSRVDKAIAALSLALANGAAGLNDYTALQAVQIPSAMDECHVGEMWD